jgi:hypothetical protein
MIARPALENQSRQAMGGSKRPCGISRAARRGKSPPSSLFSRAHGASDTFGHVVGDVSRSLLDSMALLEFPCTINIGWAVAG